jgi:hypothetical protein
MDYILYIKTCPGVKDPQDFKVGIAALELARKRLSVYQNAVGPVYEEKFMRVFVGTKDQIKFAEKMFMREFKDRIGSKEGGFSEWISNVTLEELLAFVEELRTDYFSKIVNVPEELEPLTMPMCEDLVEWAQKV